MANNCIECSSCSKELQFADWKPRNPSYRYVCVLFKKFTPFYGMAYTKHRFNFYINCPSFVKKSKESLTPPAPSLECAMCHKKFQELLEGYCTTCQTKLKEAKKLLAEFKKEKLVKNPKPKLKSKHLMGERKIQVKDVKNNPVN